MKYLIAFLLLLPTTSFAANYQNQIDNFFNLFEQGKVEQSVNSIYESNKYISSSQDQIKNIKTQLSALPSLVGQITQIKKLSEYNVKDMFVHVTYIVMYERQPVRFEFQFFNSNDNWVIYSMSFDDQLDDEIEVLARKHALKALQ